MITMWISKLQSVAVKLAANKVAVTVLVVIGMSILIGVSGGGGLYSGPVHVLRW